MPASIGVNLRVTGHCSQGGRKYMEDLFSVAYQQTEDERDLEYAFFGIYDGHGGSEAAAFAKEHLMDSIVKQRQFWSDNDEDVLKAIRNGYMLTHLNMWKELEKWPKTVTGLPSTAGTTASVAFIRRGKIYIGHVGDSAIVLGYQKEGSDEWAAKPLTSDHKPESTAEIERIQQCGGKVVSKAGVPRVVWNRPRIGHKGPIKKNTPMDEIPFLAVARSLGDLWSYNPQNDEFIVSPDPDVGVLVIDPTKFRCLIFGTDGLWNMISPAGAVSLVQATERHNEAALVAGAGAATQPANQPRDWLNPSKSLVDHALERWSNTRMRADNTSVVTLMLDPPGPPRATVLRSRTSQRPLAAPTPAPVPAPAPAPAPLQPAAANSAPTDAEPRPVPQNGLTIMTRYSDADKAAPTPDGPEKAPLPPCETLNGRFSVAPHDDSKEESEDADAITNYGNPTESYFMARLLRTTRLVNTLAALCDELAAPPPPPVAAAPSTATALPDPEPAPPADKEPLHPAAGEEPSPPPADPDDIGIQINEVSSSSPTEGPPRPRGRRPKSEARREPPAAPAPHHRVLRSHHEPDAAPRPNTRQLATRSRQSPPAAPTALTPLHRVVILGRRAPPAAAPQPPLPPPTVARADRPPPKKAPAVPAPAPAPAAPAPSSPRATRSAAHAGGAVLAQKITRGISSVARELRAAGQRAGNSARAPGPAPARRAPAARRDPSLASKENLGAVRRRARARAAPAPGPAPAAPHHRPRRHGSPPSVEVHSTTVDGGCELHPAHTPPSRALRSRNDAEPTGRATAPPAGGKRARGEPAPAAPAKAPKLAAERVARALGKRASGPWAPALALRNRLRKRLTK